MKLKNIFKWACVMTMAIPMIATLTACSNGDSDGDLDGGSTNSESVMDMLDGNAFYWHEKSYSDGSENFHNYRHYVKFEATSKTGGRCGYRVEWADTDIYGTERGTNYDNGTFSISGNKITFSWKKGEANINSMKVVGDKLIGDPEGVYEYNCKASEIQTSRLSAEEYQLEYNLCISEAQTYYQRYKDATALGDRTAAEEYKQMVINFLEAAKEVRLEAEEDGVYIEADPFENTRI